jgi:mannose-6-phosphate isomerase-like protein (cupin superfamily)
MLAKYISMAPGESTGMRMHADTRVSWIVQDGQMRVTIQGQEPFIASQGYMVQVPYQTPYKMETLGNVPSLRFEIMPARTATLYLETETPPQMAGVTFIKTRATMRNAQYSENERMSLNFADVQAGTQRGGAFVSDDRSFVNIIRGRGVARQPDTVLGHFHLEYAEFWFIMEGNIDYLIEGEEFFTSSQGDVVYVPNGRWHRASHGSPVGEMSTRIAINGFPQGLHVMEAPGVTPTPVR